jgi:hypothetical protein
MQEVDIFPRCLEIYGYNVLHHIWIFQAAISASLDINYEYMLPVKYSNFSALFKYTAQ